MRDAYLKPGVYVESEDPVVADYVHQVTGCGKPGDAGLEPILKLYYSVRDDFPYDPYDNFHDPRVFSGKRVLELGRGFCISKAALLAAGCRWLGVPSRLGFADVRNHLASPGMLELNNGDTFRWHSFTEIFISGQWRKATPAFDRALCERSGIKPLDFDGRSDSVFQEYDSYRRRHMEYVTDHGIYSDVPADSILAAFRKYCPKVFDLEFSAPEESFADEVADSRVR